MRIGITADCLKWAQGRHALGLQKYATADFTVEVRTIGDTTDRWLSGLDSFYCIYLAAARRSPAVRRLVSCVASHAWQYDAFDPADWRTRGVNKTRNHANGAKILSTLDAVICRNSQLERWARPLCKSVAMIPAGVDTEVFYPVNREQHTRLTVGFCGQVSTEHPEGNFKGFDEVFVPLMKAFERRYDFEWYTQTAANAKSQDEMRDFFNRLDVLVSCASNDCTANPVWEAMACGCAVVSTDVGQMSDAAALRKFHMLVPTYRNAAEAYQTRMCIANRLQLLESTAYRRNVQESLLASIENEYSYKVLAERTLKFVAGVD